MPSNCTTWFSIKSAIQLTNVSWSFKANQNTRNISISYISLKASQNNWISQSLSVSTSFPGSLFSASLSRWNRDPGNEVVSVFAQLFKSFLNQKCNFQILWFENTSWMQFAADFLIKRIKLSIYTQNILINCFHKARIILNCALKNWAQGVSRND